MNNLKPLTYIPRGRRACLNIVDRNVQKTIYCYRKGQNIDRDIDCPKCKYQ